MMKLSSIKTQVIFATAVIVTGSLNFILLLQMFVSRCRQLAMNKVFFFSFNLML